ncbi:hypothetical protein [Methylobacterium sp. Leaf89]|uniref:hypothetical protein n=1 Tax=Methylobacterium sp. Leaf89 TaxID=1736245 RepID=UPI0006FF2A7E|nr:hypothetical protein [Methylobacterium sp. Leaf89]KQO73530.1 hypothetical protein ASF18_17280 [Methylobacterium sp. Leaf89]
MLIDVPDPLAAARPRTAWDAHLRVPRSPTVVALATALGELALAAALLHALVGPVVVLAGHVGLCLILGLRTLQDAQAPGEAARLAHLTLWTFIGGPFGTLLAIGLALLDRGAAPPRPAEAFGTWLETEGHLDPRTDCGRLSSDLRDGRLRVGKASSVVPLADILDGGAKEAKFEALAIVGRRFDPCLTHVIRAALQDTDASVRVLASTVLAKLQTRFTRDLIALEVAVAQAPGAAGPWLALAAARRAYAESGLTEALQARTEMAAARVAASQALAAEPENTAARALLAAIEAESGAPTPPLPREALP